MKKVCLYLHVTFASGDGKIDALAKQFNKKFEDLENKFREMQNNLDSKNLEIQQIKKKYSALEISVKEIKKENMEIEERVADITQHNETFLNESIAVLENSVRVPDNPIFKCSNCKFTTESERGLKVHIKRKHEHLEEEGFPKVSEFCDYVCYIKQNMVDLLKEHSFRNLKLKYGETFLEFWVCPVWLFWRFCMFLKVYKRFKNKCIKRKINKGVYHLTLLWPA